MNRKYAVLSGCLIAGFTVLAYSLSWASQKISKDTAIQNARAFIERIGLPVPATKDMLATFERTVAPKKESAMIWYVVSRSGYSLEVDSDTGRVWFFDFVSRAEEQIKGINRTGRFFTTDQQVAKQRLIEIAQKAGFDSRAKIAKFTFRTTGVKGDSNPAGVVGALFQLNGKNYGVVNCDIQDGAPTLIFFDQ